MIRLVISLMLLLTCAISTQAASDRYEPNNRTSNNTLRVTPGTQPISDPNDQNRPSSIPSPSTIPSHSDKCEEIGSTSGKCNTGQPNRNGQIERQPTNPNKLDPATHQKRLPYRFNHVAPSLNQPYEPGQILLYFKKADTVDLRIQQIEQKFQLKPVKRIKLEALGGEIIQYQTDKDLTQLKRLLNQIAPEAIIDFNVYYFSQAGPRQYFATQIRLNSPPKKLYTHIPVGIIDTEVTQVPALQSSTILRKSFLSASARAASTKHGTAVALLIAGNDDTNQFYGVAPGSPLYVANIMRKAGRHNNTNSLLLTQAIDWLIAQDVRIINLSLGGPGDKIMQHLFKQLEEQPIIFTAAAGNSGPKAPPSYPAAYAGVIAVTATNANKQIYKNANQGDYIDIAAPGEDVWVPVSPQGQYMSGTSFSAALVAGAIAKQASQANNQPSSITLQPVLKQALDLGATGRDAVFGSGLLQVD